MSLQVIGVRHHSPACARLVADTIRRKKPRYVLIEGPSDMNERMSEFALPHSLPIALFTYRQEEDGQAFGSWSPFCAYSPEWAALETARETGAEALFIDLPAWDPAFWGEENRYSDRHVRASDRMSDSCATLGFEDSDALWDHLFEQPRPLEQLERDLTRYFEALRADEPAGDRDSPRENLMSHFAAWAVAASGDRDVVLVCGGYHKPAIERAFARCKAERPTLPPPPSGTRVGSYLIPFSFRRLDSFAGYASGMPSPRFYQAVWELGHERAGEAMLFRAIGHLRKKRQQVSPADVIAASTLARGLCALRGHAALARIDVLDGLAGALVKDALLAPLPWTRRGRLSLHTEPFLVELLAAFSGDDAGKLAKGTPQPPLNQDVESELRRVNAAPNRDVQQLDADLTTERGRARSHVLHRLLLLGIPGVQLLRAISLSRARTDITERWSLVRLLETDAALIEASLYGATLEAAAIAKLEERARGGDVLALADALLDATRAGLRSLSERGLEEMARVAAREPSFEKMGAALSRLLLLERGHFSFGSDAPLTIGPVVEVAFDRALWLCEGVRGATVTFDRPTVHAMAALRDACRSRNGSLPHLRASELCRRRARDAEAPPAMRGAALGLLASVPFDLGPPDAPPPFEGAEIATVLKTIAHPQTCGDFLAGLFALARAELLSTPDLLATVDTLVSSFADIDFLIAIPALRQAFAFFPPRERLTLAEGILALGNESRADPRALVGGAVDETAIQKAALLEQAALVLARRFGLGDAMDDGDAGRGP